MKEKIVLGALVLAAGVSALVLASERPDVDAVLAGRDHDDHPDLRGVVVIQGGRRVLERYYNGASSNELHDIRSAGKSITALLVGIAMDRGMITSVEDSVSRYCGRPLAAPSAQSLSVTYHRYALASPLSTKTPHRPATKIERTRWPIP